MSDLVLERTVAESQSERSEIVLPADSNALGSLFGGRLMQYIDLVGAMAASRHARAFTVTASMDHLDFVAPVRVGELLILKASVNRAFRTSMEIGVRVMVEDVREQRLRHVSSAYLTFVRGIDWLFRRLFQRQSTRSVDLRTQGDDGRCVLVRRRGRKRCGQRLELAGTFERRIVKQIPSLRYGITTKF
jgi:acyl-CoA hydrolase